jgi:threonine dehydrogenase-like Zn-dependent dehydrogenase
MGATTIIAVDTVAARLVMAKRMGADIVVDFNKENPVEAIMRLTDGRGVDVAIEALGTQSTFESALRVLRPGGVLSSLGVYSSDLTIPVDAITAGLSDKSIRMKLCTGGKERMRRVMSVISSGRIDLGPLVTHRFKLDQIEEAYDLFANKRDGVLKVAITP